MITWLPAASDVTSRNATPLEFKVPVPRDVAPSRKVTVPFGAVVPDTGLTVAVSVTLAPNVDGFSDDARATVLAVMFTVWVSAAEVEPL